MIATTTISSMSEKPFWPGLIARWLRILCSFIFSSPVRVIDGSAGNPLFSGLPIDNHQFAVVDIQ